MLVCHQTVKCIQLAKASVQMLGYQNACFMCDSMCYSCMKHQTGLSLPVFKAITV